jgi:hypothetical protein
VIVITGRDKFTAGLEELGLQPETRDENKVIVPYVVGEGRFAGQQIKVGFEVPADFEITPPGGLHISPRLIPINTSPEDHSRAAESPFGPEWEYLSRPYTQWAFKRTVKRYIEYVAHLINTL